MQTVEELKENQAKELAQLEKELAIREACPVIPSRVCLHAGSATLTYVGEGIGKRLSLTEAARIYGAFAIEPSEHWRDGCLNCCPAEINEYAKKESAVMDGGDWVELVRRSYGSRGEYSGQELRFWTKVLAGCAAW